MPVLGLGAGIPLIQAPPQPPTCLLHPMSTAAPPSPAPREGPSTHWPLCTQRLFTLKPTDSSSERHHGVLTGALGVGGFLPLLSKETQMVTLLCELEPPPDCGRHFPKNPSLPIPNPGQHPQPTNPRGTKEFPGHPVSEHPQSSQQGTEPSPRGLGSVVTRGTLVPA